MRSALGKVVAMNRLPTDVLAASVLCLLAVTLALITSSVSWAPVFELLSAGRAMDCDLSKGSLLGSSKQQ
jgi:hypothetical protein